MKLRGGKKLNRKFNFFITIETMPNPVLAFVYLKGSAPN
jgi:hypothetical protein